MNYSDPNIERSLKVLKAHYPNMRCIELKKPIQDIKSNFCGLYSTAFVLSNDHRIQETMGNFVGRFSVQNDLMNNDKIVLDYIVQFIEKFGVNK